MLRECCCQMRLLDPQTHELLGFTALGFLLEYKGICVQTSIIRWRTQFILATYLLPRMSTASHWMHGCFGTQCTRRQKMRQPRHRNLVGADESYSRRRFSNKSLTPKVLPNLGLVLPYNQVASPLPSEMGGY